MSHHDDNTSILSDLKEYSVNTSARTEICQRLWSVQDLTYLVYSIFIQLLHSSFNMELESKSVSKYLRLNRENKSYFAKPYTIQGRHFNATLENAFGLQGYEVESLHMSQP
jgi:hypothetical protein